MASGLPSTRGEGITLGIGANNCESSYGSVRTRMAWCINAPLRQGWSKKIDRPALSDHIARTLFDSLHPHTHHEVVVPPSRIRRSRRAVTADTSAPILVQQLRQEQRGVGTASIGTRLGCGILGSLDTISPRHRHDEPMWSLLLPPLETFAPSLDRHPSPRDDAHHRNACHAPPIVN
ncbi:PREDICTED: uncharacterized protein LOC108684727 [Atta colombica]|uniref:uncharacterized protein LOC108684727 n=1 Tax=Atta colombica TaxID=520822 RepID=UPI00084C1FE1|nr:PREDICTED: uncharacterized protein LOC108684727 [Atta colombica]